MSTVKTLYGSSGQAITLSLASLANGASRASGVVSNTTNKFLDALVSLKVKTGASGVSSTGSVALYAYASVDGGTTYTAGATGSDAAITLVNPTSLVLIGLLGCVANATTYYFGPVSIASAFGGGLPEKWGIVVTNSTGAALDATEASHSLLYQGTALELV
jgi:hypothetical protein